MQKGALFRDKAEMVGKRLQKVPVMFRVMHSAILPAIVEMPRTTPMDSSIWVPWGKFNKQRSN